MHVFNRFLVVPKRSPAYRPEIDGLRAVAVVAVLINHLNERLLPGGFLGVDIFFVISGYVVTSSLLAREDGSSWQFLARFYGRRVRRLLPALVVNIVVVSILFSLFASPLDDFYAPIMRTGTAAIFGVSNLYLLRQRTGYFAGDNYFKILCTPGPSVWRNSSILSGRPSCCFVGWVWPGLLEEVYAG